MTTAALHPDEVCISPRVRTRIAIVDHTAALGGGEIALLNFVARLDRSKYDPLVILFSDGPLRRKLKEVGVEPKVFPLNPSINNTRKGTLGAKTLLRIPQLLAAIGFVLRLTKLFRHEGVAMIHTNSLKSDILGGLAGRLAGIPVIWHVRDRIEPDYLPKNVVRVFRLLAAIIPKHIVANSAATFATLHIRQKQKHFTVYSGIIPLPRPLRVVHDGTNVQDGEKESDRPVDSAPVIGLVGRITRWKGQHIFIQAAAQVLKRFPTAQFQIIGSALFDEYEYEREVRQLANELGIARAVRFLGFRPDVQELITKLQILVHASILGEPFGQVIVEGMAAGKPVVATNGGGVPEIVIDGVTGFLVPMGDATAMATVIERLLENPKMMNEMGTAGQRRAESHFSIDQTVRKIEQIYQYFGSHA